MVKISVPGTLMYRDVVLRVVGSMCRLVRSGVRAEQEADHRPPVADFDDKSSQPWGKRSTTSRSTPIPARRRATAELELTIHRDLLTIRLFDTGEGFDPFAELEPDLESLPESHMGLFIMRACMDEVAYCRGVAPAPNVLTLTKRYFVRDATDAPRSAD